MTATERLDAVTREAFLEDEAAAWEALGRLVGRVLDGQGRRVSEPTMRAMERFLGRVAKAHEWLLGCIAKGPENPAFRYTFRVNDGPEVPLECRPVRE